MKNKLSLTLSRKIEEVAIWQTTIWRVFPCKIIFRSMTASAWNKEMFWVFDFANWQSWSKPFEQLIEIKLEQKVHQLQGRWSPGSGFKAEGVIPPPPDFGRIRSKLCPMKRPCIKQINYYLHRFWSSLNFDAKSVVMFGSIANVNPVFWIRL